MALEVNNENISDVLSKNKLTILQFSAEWCGPCKMLSPIMLKLSEANTDNDVLIGKINVDTNSDLGSKYGVRNIPTLIFLKDGVEVERSAGLKTQVMLQEMIDNLLSN
jgi:thioredoxin 1